VSTPIEDFLFDGRGVHAVLEFTQGRHSIRLRVCPWDEMDNSTEAVFDHARVTSIEVYADDADGLNMPWDIIGMDCYELDRDRWRFVLQCGGIEYCFESSWPSVTRC
jgi:hypothetical protein